MGDEINEIKKEKGKRKPEIKDFDKPSNQLACLNSDTGLYAVRSSALRKMLFDGNLIECPGTKTRAKIKHRD